MARNLKIPFLVVAAAAAGFFLSQTTTDREPSKPLSGENAKPTLGDPQETTAVKSETALSSQPVAGLLKNTDGSPSAAEIGEPSPSPVQPAKPDDGSASSPSPSPDGAEASSPMPSREDEKNGGANEKAAKTGKKNPEEGAESNYGFESADTTGEDIVEFRGRLDALEQAFSVDSRRNKARPGAPDSREQDIETLKESLASLYEIVQSFPSIDTLETKISAVDGAVEEMNVTLEHINAVASKMEAPEIDTIAKVSSAAAEAANEALREIKKLGDAVPQIEKKLAELSDKKPEVGSEALGEVKKALEEEKLRNQGLEKKNAELEEKVTSLASEQVSITTQMGEMKASLDKIRSAIGAAEQNIVMTDKNVRLLSDSYGKVYTNAIRVDKKLSALEARDDETSDRVGTLERHIFPPAN